MGPLEQFRGSLDHILKSFGDALLSALERFAGDHDLPEGFDAMLVQSSTHRAAHGIKLAFWTAYRVGAEGPPSDASDVRMDRFHGLIDLALGDFVEAARSAMKSARTQGWEIPEGLEDNVSMAARNSIENEVRRAVWDSFRRGCDDAVDVDPPSAERLTLPPNTLPMR